MRSGGRRYLAACLREYIRGGGGGGGETLFYWYVVMFVAFVSKRMGFPSNSQTNIGNMFGSECWMTCLEFRQSKQVIL